jgi:hypothetical protein
LYKESAKKHEDKVKIVANTKFKGLEEENGCKEEK